MGSFGFSFLGSAVSLKARFLGNMVKRLLTNPFLRRWSRFRHKRIRGIGSQAASRRGAKSRRLAFAFKARSFSGLAFVSHWMNCFQPSFVRDRMSRQRSAIWQTTCLVLVVMVASFSVRGALCIFQSWCVIGTLLDDTEAASEVFISLWSSPSAVSLSHFPRTVAAPFPRICFWGLLSLCSSLCVYGFRHVSGSCCAPLASRVFGRFRISNFPRLGATIAITLVLWQISFLGIRVGEASNPGPTMSNSVPVSDGVTTPLPQYQHQDLEISVPGLASHPPGSLPVTAPSLSLAPVAHPYVSVPPPPQSLFVRPSRFCSFSRPGSAARRSPSQARTAPHRSRSPPQASTFSVSGQSSCPPPSHTRARLFCPVPSCPDHARPSHGWATFGSMRSHIDAQLTGQLLGDIPMDWLRGLGFSTGEVCQRVLSLRFNGRCPSCFRPFSAQHGGDSVLLAHGLKVLQVFGTSSPVTGGFVLQSPRVPRMPSQDVSFLPSRMWLLIEMSSHGLIC